MDKGIKVVGVDPAKNIANIANNNNIPTVNEYFNSNTVHTIIEKYGKANLVTASNVFAHSDKLVDIANGAFELLKDDGVFIVEVQYLLNTINDLTFDNIYHEHVNYWSVTSINNFFNNLNLTVCKVEHVDTHGGSIRVYIKRNGCVVDSSVKQYLENEHNFGINKLNKYKEFGNNINNIKQIVNENINKLKEKYNVIAAYGSPAKATTSLNYFGINSNHINFCLFWSPMVPRNNLCFCIYRYMAPNY
jgi:hypothetical protein